MRRQTIRRAFILVCAVVIGYPVIEALVAPAEACCHAGGARREGTGRNRATQPSRPPQRQRVVPRMRTPTINPAQRRAGRVQRPRDSDARNIPEIALPPIEAFLVPSEPLIYLDDGFYAIPGADEAKLGDVNLDQAGDPNAAPTTTLEGTDETYTDADFERDLETLIQGLNEDGTDLETFINGLESAAPEDCDEDCASGLAADWLLDQAAAVNYTAPDTGDSAPSEATDAGPPPPPETPSQETADAGGEAPEKKKEPKNDLLDQWLSDVETKLEDQSSKAPSIPVDAPAPAPPAKSPGDQAAASPAPTPEPKTMSEFEDRVSGYDKKVPDAAVWRLPDGTYVEIKGATYSNGEDKYIVGTITHLDKKGANIGEASLVRHNDQVIDALIQISGGTSDPITIAEDMFRDSKGRTTEIYNATEMSPQQARAEQGGNSLMELMTTPVSPTPTAEKVVVDDLLMIKNIATGYRQGPAGMY